MGPGDLDDLREIKRLRYEYFRCIDSKDWQGFRELLAEDAVVLAPDTGEPLVFGRDAIVELLETFVANATTVHCGQTPQIAFVSPTVASGVWTMFDFADYGDRGWVGAGYYYDEYVKMNGRWKIRSFRLTRERLDWWECGLGGRSP